VIAASANEDSRVDAAACFAEFVCNFEFNLVPDNVVARAKLCILDALVEKLRLCEKRDGGD
jgi:hypothetical protein